MLPQPMTPMPNGSRPVTGSWLIGREPRSPGRGAVSHPMLSRTAVSMSVAHRSSSTTCHSAAGAAARISATGIRPVPTAVIGSSLVTGPSFTCR